MNHSLERDVTYPYQWQSRGCWLPEKPCEPHPEPVYPLRGFLLSPLCGLPHAQSPCRSNRDGGASNLPSLAGNPAMMRVLQERLPQLAHRYIAEALANVE